ncbi:ATP-binding cassette domain-containing protein, partial [Mesotoga sp. TolDC]|uniref:ATP-binding cassette domain-containing protein n=1 Tax=Mesotoga sp. TolDC TaxID=1389250 RepID=UPI0035C79506
MLSVDRLNLSFEDKSGRRKILDDVSFSIEAGEIVGIVGLSGAGKTSLLRTLNLLQPVDSSSIGFLRKKPIGSTCIAFAETNPFI